MRQRLRGSAGLARLAVVVAALVLLPAAAARARALDPSFGEGGRVVRSAVEGRGPYIPSTQLAEAPDGTIYVL